MMKNVLILGGALVLCCGVAGESKAFDCRLEQYNVICYDDDGKEIFNKSAGSGWNYDEATNTFTSYGGSKIVVDNSNNSIKYNVGGWNWEGGNENYNYTFNAGGSVTQISATNGLGDYVVADYIYDDSGNYTRAVSANYGSGVLSYGVFSGYTDTSGKYTGTTYEKIYNDGSISTEGYDANGRYTGGSYAETDTNGYTITTNYDGNHESTGRTLTDSNGQPVNDTVTSGNYTYTVENGVLTGYTITNTDPNGNSESTSYDANGRRTGTSYTDADGDPLNGFANNTWCYGCLYEDGKLITNGFYDESGVFIKCENSDVSPCTGEVIAYRPNENGGYSKMTCTDSSLSDCTTEQFDKKGKLIAEYDNDNQLIAKYDYDNSGNLAGTYDDQCVLQSCSSGHLEKNGSCIPAATGCGAGYKQIENWCNHIQWTPAEAAAVLTDDNNNSVTITFRK